MALSPDTVFAFGPFTLHVGAKLLLRDQQPVRLGGRAHDLLTCLVDQAGQVLGHQALTALVWPRTVVEGTSLRAHVSNLRKALGDGQDGARYIANVPGRGYSFVAEVTRQQAEAPVSRLTPSPASSVPMPLNPPIGRQALIDQLLAALAHRRFVSVVGPGGMGKTRVAVAVAQASTDRHADGVQFVDLTLLADPRLVPCAFAAALGLTVPPDDPWPPLRAFLRNRQLLVVLDNCEHLVDAAAQLAENALRDAPGLRLLATSREPLDAEGEWVHRIPPLDMPGVDATVALAAAAAAPAVRLFVERATANSLDFALTEDNLSTVLHLCRRLDGMPLAIELAAGRIDTLGVHGLAERIDALFGVLTRGRRTALPRHRTLRALLDWSHDLLSDRERTVLRRLSVFRASFTLEAAAEVAAGPDLTTGAVVDAVMSLATRSLVDTVTDGESPRFRLLHTTRAYAADRLADSGELDATSRRHAVHVHGALGRTADMLDGLQQGATSTSMPRVGWLMDEVRTALVWATSSSGDAALGVALTVAGTDLVFELGLFDEWRPWAARALHTVDALDPPDRVLELRTCVMLCFLGGVTVGTGPSAEALLARTGALADAVDSREQRVKALFGMCVNSFGRGDYTASAELARRIGRLADGPDDPVKGLLSDRFLALTHHYLGDHAQSRALAARVLALPATRADRQYIGHIPREVTMRILLARMQWLGGEVDQAVATAAEALAHAEAAKPGALTQALALAVIPVAMWRGDDAQAAAAVDRLAQHALRHAQGYWTVWADGCRVALARRAGLPGPTADVAHPVHAMALDFLATVDPASIDAPTVARSDLGTVGWCAPEVLRAQAEQSLRADPAAAEAGLLRALQLARNQQALSWELRAATSLARHWAQAQRLAEAQAVLAAPLARFTEGEGTVDLRAARSLARTLGLPHRHNGSH